MDLPGCSYEKQRLLLAHGCYPDESKFHISLPYWFCPSLDRILREVDRGCCPKMMSRETLQAESILYMHSSCGGIGRLPTDSEW